MFHLITYFSQRKKNFFQLIKMGCAPLKAKKGK